MLDDENLIKAFLKKQKEIQDKFLIDFTSQQVSVDTKKLESLIHSYDLAVYKAQNLKPQIDSAAIQGVVDRAVNSAVDNAQFTQLIDSVGAQTRAIERNNLILQQGTGQMLKWWVILLIALFSFGIGWGVNWYFEIPQQVVKANRYKVLQILYDDTNNTMANDCTLAKRYYKDKGWSWDSPHCNYTDEQGNTFANLPLRTSDSVISGH